MVLACRRKHQYVIIPTVRIHINYSPDRYLSVLDEDNSLRVFPRSDSSNGCQITCADHKEPEDYCQCNKFHHRFAVLESKYFWKSASFISQFFPSLNNPNLMRILRLLVQAVFDRICNRSMI